MTYFNPMASSLASANQVARIQGEDKSQSLRRAQAQQKITSPNSPDPQHEVENTDSVVLQTQEDHHEDPRKRKRKRPQEEKDETPPEESLDIRA